MQFRWRWVDGGATMLQSMLRWICAADELDISGTLVYLATHASQACGCLILGAKAVHINMWVSPLAFCLKLSSSTVQHMRFSQLRCILSRFSTLSSSWKFN